MHNGHLKTRQIRKQWGSEIRPFEIQKYLESRILEVRISNGPVFKGTGYSFSYSNGPNHLKTRPIKIWTFLSGFQMVLYKMAAMCPVFRSHLKSWPFEKQPHFNHSKSRLAQILDPHCIEFFLSIHYSYLRSKSYKHRQLNKIRVLNVLPKQHLWSEKCKQRKAKL